MRNLKTGTAKDMVRIFLIGYMGAGKTTLGSALAQAAGLSFNAVSAAVNKLCSLGIMRERTTSARNRAFEYTAYLDILRLGT